MRPSNSRESSRGFPLPAILVLLLLAVPPGILHAQADESPVLADLFVNGEGKGPAEFTLDAEGRPVLPFRLVRDALAGIARPEAIALLEDEGGLVRAEALAAQGVELSFDRDGLALRLVVRPGAMVPVDLGAGRDAGVPAGGRLLEVEPFSAILGLSLRLDPGLSLAGTDDAFAFQGELGLSPAVNVLGFVASADMDLRLSEGFSFDLHEASLTRDFPGLGARLSGGIVDVKAVSFQAAAELLGLSFRREEGVPDGRAERGEAVKEIVLERSADVTVSMNGTTVRSYRLEAGAYRLSDLPLASGLNDVLVEIREEGEEPRRIRMGLPFDAGILKPGEADYALSLGVDRDAPQRFLASGYFSLGILRELELGADLVAGFGSLLGGVSGTWATPAGSFGAAAGLCLPYEGTAAGVPSFGSRLSWRLALPVLRYAPSVGLAASYRAPGFAAPDPGFPEKAAPSASRWSFSAQVGQRIPGIPGSAGLYGDAGVEDGALGSLSLHAGLHVSLTPSVLLSLSGGADWSPEAGWEPQASLSVSVVPPDRRTLQYRQDFLENRSRFDVSMGLDAAGRSTLGIGGEGLGGDAGTRSATVAVRTETDFLGLAASASYGEEGSAAGRLEADLAASTTLAFAGGVFAAAKSLGDAFAILVPDPSVGTERVEIRPSGGAPVASEGGRPVLIDGLVPYRPFFAAVEMPESPPDRRPEPTAVRLVPGYRSVAVIRVRSAASIAVRGRLVDGAGKPLTNLAGDLPDGSGTFTDEEGFFECYDLEAGEQRIRWSDGSVTRFAADVSWEGTMGDLGDVRAGKAAEGGGGT